VPLSTTQSAAAPPPGLPSRLLELRQLRVSYGKTAALHGLTCASSRGEVVALIGANGAGKSTTLRAISGLLKPAGGEILFEGHSIGGLPADRIVAQGIAHRPRSATCGRP
jgi:branched-chain amino acid transport system ATP-binding protein